MAGTVIHADDTPVPVLAPGNGKTKTGRLWIYLRELYESAEGKPANVTEVACWAHVRRKFFDVHKANGSAIAREALERIGALFDIERTIAGKSADRHRAPELGQGEARRARRMARPAV